MLVEDEDAVLELAREVLQAGGYTVLEARHDQQALEIADVSGYAERVAAGEDGLPAAACSPSPFPPRSWPPRCARPSMFRRTAGTERFHIWPRPGF